MNNKRLLEIYLGELSDRALRFLLLYLQQVIFTAA